MVGHSYAVMEGHYNNDAVTYFFIRDEVMGHLCWDTYLGWPVRTPSDCLAWVISVLSSRLRTIPMCMLASYAELILYNCLTLVSHLLEVANYSICMYVHSYILVQPNWTLLGHIASCYCMKWVKNDLWQLRHFWALLWSDNDVKVLQNDPAHTLGITMHTIQAPVWGYLDYNGLEQQFFYT